jgi:hypothetical protein
VRNVPHNSLKIITGAVIGSLSIAGQKEWGKPKTADVQQPGRAIEEAQQASGTDGENGAA